MEFNGIAAHEFFEISLLQGHITERNFDIYFSKTFLNSSNDSEYGRLKIEGYNLMRADHASRLKKEVFVFTIRNIFPSLEVMNFEH